MLRNDLAADAVQFNNGAFIEDIISGFTTLSSANRNVLTKEVNMASFRTDGSMFNSSRYPAKEIQVSYILIGSSVEDFNTKLRKLHSLLDDEAVDVTFNDDGNVYYRDCYFSLNEPEEEHRLWQAGTYTIYCTDGFKYSKAVNSMTASGVGKTTLTMNINYQGTYPSKPVLKAKFASAYSGGNYSQDGDCGYVSFSSGNGSLIQLGNVDIGAKDGAATDTSIINCNFRGIGNWTKNSATAPHFFPLSVVSYSMNQSYNDTYYNSGSGRTFSEAKQITSWGTAPASGYYGSALSQTFSTGYSDYELKETLYLFDMSGSEVGGHCVGIFDSNGACLTGIKILKDNTSSKVHYIVNGETVRTDNINLSVYNPNFGRVNRTTKTTSTIQYYNKKTKKWQTKKIKGAKTRTVNNTSYSFSPNPSNEIAITKQGAQVKFKCGTMSYTHSDAAIESIEGKTAVIQDVNLVGGIAMYNYQNSFSWRGVGYSFTDSQNVFMSGDTVIADTSDMSVRITRDDTNSEGVYDDAALHAEYGALGNDWETFMLEPGNNNIYITWSKWVDKNYAPSFSIEWNEVFI